MRVFAIEGPWFTQERWAPILIRVNKLWLMDVLKDIFFICDIFVILILITHSPPHAAIQTNWKQQWSDFSRPFICTPLRCEPLVVLKALKKRSHVIRGWAYFAHPTLMSLITIAYHRSEIGVRRCLELMGCFWGEMHTTGCRMDVVHLGSGFMPFPIFRLVGRIGIFISNQGPWHFSKSHNCMIIIQFLVYNTKTCLIRFRIILHMKGSCLAVSSLCAHILET